MNRSRCRFARAVLAASLSTLLVAHSPAGCAAGSAPPGVLRTTGGSGCSDAGRWRPSARRRPGRLLVGPPGQAGEGVARGRVHRRLASPRLERGERDLLRRLRPLRRLRHGVEGSERDHTHPLRHPRAARAVRGDPAGQRHRRLHRPRREPARWAATAPAGSRSATPTPSARSATAGSTSSPTASTTEASQRIPTYRAPTSASDPTSPRSTASRRAMSQMA